MQMVVAFSIVMILVMIDPVNSAVGGRLYWAIFVLVRLLPNVCLHGTLSLGIRMACKLLPRMPHPHNQGRVSVRGTTKYSY